MRTRLTPFDLVFASVAEERFPAIRASLESSRLDPHDLDAFVLDRQATQMLRELVPDEGVGEGIRQHAALLHHAYLVWHEGGWQFRLSRARTEALLASGPADPDPSGAAVPRAYYIQFPERLVWAEVVEDQPYEPLDGLFIRPWPNAGYFVLGVFGVHPARLDFSVVEVEGYRSDQLERRDGAPLFASLLPGGRSAGLYSVSGEEEMLELAARTVPLVAEATSRMSRDAPPREVIEIG